MQALRAPSLCCGRKRCIRLPRRPRPSKAANGAAELLGATMDMLTISELMHLTREELCDLSQQIERSLK
jgi:hypothetical protein